MITKPHATLLVEFLRGRTEMLVGTQKVYTKITLKVSCAKQK